MLGQLIMSGVATGSLYALTAVAVVVVFRNTRTINLAQGDFAMIGAFLGIVFLKQLGLNYYASIALAVVCCMGLGVLTERLIMRRIADADWLTLFTATLGVYYILHGVSGWIWGRDTKAFPVTFDATPVHILGTIVSEGHLVNLAWAAGSAWSSICSSSTPRKGSPCVQSPTIPKRPSSWGFRCASSSC